MFNLEKPQIQATIHMLKVAVFIAIAGAMTTLLSNLGKLNLDATTTVVVTAVINLILAWVKKYQEVK